MKSKPGKRLPSSKPRNPIARSTLLRKGAAHEHRGKYAKRAVQQERTRRLINDET